MKVPAPSVPSTQPAPRTRTVPVAIGEPLENYTKIPNELDYLYTGNKLSGLVQAQIVWFVIRATWGDAKRPEWVRISLGKLGRLCGGTDPGAMTRAIRDLVDRHIIAEKKGQGCTTVGSYKVTPEKWKDAKPYEPKVVPDAQATVGEEDDELPGDDPGRPENDKLIVRPGRRARLIASRLVLKDREPVDFRISYRNSGSQPIEVSAVTKADLVLISFGEQADSEANKKRKTIAYRQQFSDKSLSNQQISDFGFSVRKLFQSIFDRPFTADNPADQKFLRKVMKAAGDDVPAAFFEDYCRREIRAMVRKRKEVYPGILVSLAGQAAKIYAATPQQTPPVEPPPPPPPPAELPADPRDLDCERCFATGRNGHWKNGIFIEFKDGSFVGPCPDCAGTGKKLLSQEAHA